MTVKAWLNGDRFDLETLAYLFAVGEVQVIYDDDQNSYYLTAPDIDNPSEDGRFDIPAESLLRRMNGLARIYSPGYRPVKLVAKYTDSNGGTTNSSHQQASRVAPLLVSRRCPPQATRYRTHHLLGSTDWPSQTPTMTLLRS